MLNTILGYLNVIFAVAQATPDGAAWEKHVAPAIAKAQTVIAGLSGLAAPTSLANDVTDLGKIVDVLHTAGLIPQDVLQGLAGKLLTIPAALASYKAGQAVPAFSISVEGIPGRFYAVSDNPTPEIKQAFGLSE